MKDIIYSRSAYLEFLNKVLERAKILNENRNIEVKYFLTKDEVFDDYLRHDIYGMYADADLKSKGYCKYNGYLRMYYVSPYIVSSYDFMDEYRGKYSTFDTCVPLEKVRNVKSVLSKKTVENKIPCKLLGFIPWYTVEYEEIEESIEVESFDIETHKQYYERIVKEFDQETGIERLIAFNEKYRSIYYRDIIYCMPKLQNKYPDLIEELEQVIEKIDSIPDAMFSIDTSTFDRYNKYIN